MILLIKLKNHLFVPIDKKVCFLKPRKHYVQYFKRTMKISLTCFGGGTSKKLLRTTKGSGGLGKQLFL